LFAYNKEPYTLEAKVRAEVKTSHRNRSVATSSKLAGTPIAATLVSAVLAVVVTLYGDGFVVLSTGCAVFLYISYVMPTAAGLLAEGKTWTQKGPFDLGRLSKPMALLAVLGGALLVFVGMQPPNEKVLYLTIAMIVGMIAFWFLFGESKRFKGPPNIQ
jgi:amino acid transporter